jgi:hypothetical protein|tara:strand:- start:2200 stop:3645 length:1446 start_codon:yes stop_codon:yes gene_type:complete
MARPSNRLQAQRAGAQPNYTRVAGNMGTSNNVTSLPAASSQGGAYVILSAGDVVVSNDSVTAPMWSSNNPTLNYFYTSSTQVSSNVQEYYTSVFQTASTEVSAEIQFDIAYCDQVGSGSQFLNNLVTGSTPTRTNYGQYRNLVFGDENAAFIFSGVTSSMFYALPIERARYKQTSLPGTWTMYISGSDSTLNTTVDVKAAVISTPSGMSAATYNNVSLTGGSGTNARADIIVASATTFTSIIFDQGSGYKAGDILTIAAADIGGGSAVDVEIRLDAPLCFNGGSIISLTDDSKLSSTTQFCDAGRIYQIVSGSAGVLGGNLKNVNGYTQASGSYGYLLPDINTLILNGEALNSVPEGGGINLDISRSFDTKGNNSLNLVDALQRAGNQSLGFTINSQEDLSSDYIFCRAKNSEYNYSSNPSFISSSTGAVLFNEFVENPTTYITTVGLYNISQELLAVAKLSRPLEKNFTKELLVRVKLDF